MYKVYPIILVPTYIILVVMVAVCRAYIWHTFRIRYEVASIFRHPAAYILYPIGIVCTGSERFSCDIMNRIFQYFAYAAVDLYTLTRIIMVH